MALAGRECLLTVAVAIATVLLRRRFGGSVLVVNDSPLHPGNRTCHATGYSRPACTSAIRIELPHARLLIRTDRSSGVQNLVEIIFGAGAADETT